MSTCLCTGTPPCWVCKPLEPSRHDDTQEDAQ